MKRLTTEEFKCKSKIIHNNKYDYSLVEYSNNSTKLKRICPIHGEFEQIPNSHLLGKGCSKCNNFNTTNDDFSNKAKLVHGNRYDYSLINYKHSKLVIKIKCSADCIVLAWENVLLLNPCFRQKRMHPNSHSFN